MSNARTHRTVHTAIILAVTGMGIATAARANSWTGGDGNWNTPANWSKGYLPGSQSQSGFTYPAGPWDDVSIINGSTVTIDSDLNSGGNPLNIRGLLVNDGGNPTHTGYTSGTTLTVATGGYLSLEPSQISTGHSLGVANGYDATINISGGQLVNLGSITLGNGIGWGGSPAVQNQVGTGTLNVSAGFLGRNENFTTGATGMSITVGSKSNGVINLSGGTINTGQYGSVTLGASTPATGFETYGTGLIKQTGGTLENGRAMTVGSAAPGRYELSAGTLVTGTNNAGLTVGKNAKGEFIMTGGTLTTSTTTTIGGGTGDGLLSISDGDVSGPRFVVGNVGLTGTGELRTIGSAGSISLSTGAGGSPLRSYDNGTLDFQIGATGVSTIIANNSAPTDGRTIINLAGTLKLELLDGYTPDSGDQFVLVSTNITAAARETTDSKSAILGAGIFTDVGTYYANNLSGGYTNAGLSLDASNVGSWTYSVDPTYASNGTTINGYQLVATYVPEPTSLSLLAVGGLALLRRRRGR